MTQLQEMIIGLVMLLTSLGTIAVFITFYLDDRRTAERSSGHPSRHRRGHGCRGSRF